MNVTELFDDSLVGRADKPALDYEDGGVVRTLTFGEIEARANRMANELTSRGVAAGDRLCVHLANGVGFLDVFLACVRLGVIMVPINVLYRVLELQHILADADPKATVIHAGSDASYPEGAALWTIEELETAAASRSASRPVVNTNEKTPALIIYTSGTTGKAKGAVLSHGNLIANGKVLVDAWRITENDRYLAVLPLFHVHGLANGVHCWLISGCRMRLCERFEQAKAAQWFIDFKPTLFFGVPTVYVRLMDPEVIPAAHARAIESHMRLFVSGSAPLSRQVFDTFRDRFGHVILERYGMSEALMIISNPYDGERRAGTVGQPLPGVLVRIVSDDGEATHDVGEIQIRSPALFSEYWRRPDATRDAFTRDGWFRTGDLGLKHSDGRYELMGRNHDLIISGGFNVYPREIEDALVELGMREAVVVGVPDEARGEVPVAYVVSADSFDATLVLRLLKSRLASFKTPRALIRVDALPRTALGKVQKHLLPPWKP